MNQKYSWRKHQNADAQAVGEWLSSLSDVSAENIVKLAKRKNCPAHDVFDWSDESAAHEYRLVQARVMVRSLKVEIVNKKKEAVEIDAFIASSERGQYVATLEASDDELTAEEERFLGLIDRLEARYANLDIARAVIAAIRNTRKSAARRKKKAA